MGSSKKPISMMSVKWLFFSLECGKMDFLDAVADGHLVTALAIKEERERIESWGKDFVVDISTTLVGVEGALLLPLVVKAGSSRKAGYYVSWFNLLDCNGDSMRRFKRLGNQPDIPLFFYSEDNELVVMRELANGMKGSVGGALKVFDDVVGTGCRWTVEQFDSAVASVLQACPTPRLIRVEILGMHRKAAS